jgi:hypothetical protein
VPSARQAWQGLPDQRVSLVRREQTEPRVRPVSLVRRERTELLVRPVSLVRREQTELLVRWALPGLRDLRALPERPESTEQMEPRDRRAPREPPDQQELPDRLAGSDCQGPMGQPAQPVRREL